MRPLNRARPKGPTNAYTTFAVRSPLDTHFRKATCEEIDCPEYIQGWQLRKEDLTPELLYTATHCGRKYQEIQIKEGETYLVFEPGQPCFRESTHIIPNGRPELFYAGSGDFRSFRIRNARQHANAENFVDEMATTLDKIRTLQERG